MRYRSYIISVSLHVCLNLGVFVMGLGYDSGFLNVFFLIAVSLVFNTSAVDCIERFVSPK